MYVSLNTTGIGQVQFTGANAVYADILGDAAKEKRLLDFIVNQGINSLAIYDLEDILPNATKATALVSFMARARASGVLRIEAIGTEADADWDRIRTFHNGKAPFDGFVTEIEFWSGGSFASFLNALKYIRSLQWNPTADGKAPTTSVYLGYPTSQQVEDMTPYIDRAYIHCYVATAPEAYAYGAQRFGYFSAANKKLGAHVVVRPIFSAEGHAWSAGPEYFMGEWLGANSIAQADSLFLKDWTAAAWGSSLPLDGYQYYEYFFMDKFLKPVSTAIRRR